MPAFNKRLFLSSKVKSRFTKPSDLILEIISEKRKSKMETLARKEQRKAKQCIFGLDNMKVGLNQETLDKLEQLLNLPIMKGNIEMSINADSLANPCKRILDFVGQLATEAAAFVLIVFVIYMMIKYKWCKTVFSIITSVILAKYVTKPIIDKIISLYEEPKEMERENATTGMKIYDVFIKSDISSMVFKMLTIGTVMVILKKIPSQKDLDVILTRLDRLPKAIMGAGKLMDIIGDSWKISEEFIKEKVYGEEPILRFDGGKREIEDWINEMKKFDNPEIWNQILVDPKLVDDIMALYVKGLDLTSRYGEFQRPLIETIKGALPTMKSLYQQALNSGANNMSTRVKPMCLWLAGDTAIGKTGATIPLAGELLKEMGVLKPEDFKKNENCMDKHIYSRAVHQEFWDGYVSQEIVIYDDAFQCIDSQNNPNLEYHEIIKGVNLFPWNLHMASLAQKNNTLFRAKAVILTTNDMRIAPKSLISPEAIISRISHPYVVTIKNKYKDETGRLNVEKAMSEMKRPGPNLNIYLFQKMQLQANSEGIPVGAPMSYFEVVKELKGYIRKSTHQQQEMKHAINDYLAGDLDSYEQEFIKEVGCVSCGIGCDSKICEQCERGYTDADVEFVKNNLTKQCVKLDDVILPIKNFFKRDGVYVRKCQAEYAQYISKSKLQIKQQQKFLFEKTRIAFHKWCLRLQMIFKNIVNKITTFAKDHPYITACICISSVISLFFLVKKMFCKDIKAEKGEIMVSEEMATNLFWADDYSDYKDIISNKRINEFVIKNASMCGTSGDDKTRREKRTVMRGKSGDEKTRKERFIAMRGKSGDDKTLKGNRVNMRLGVPTIVMAMDELVSLLRSLQLDRANILIDEQLHKLEKIDNVWYICEGMEMKDSQRQPLKKCFSSMKEMIRPKTTQCTDVQAEELATRMAQQTYWMEYVKDDVTTPMGSVLIIRGTTAIMPYHFVQMLRFKNVDKVLIRNTFNKEGIEVDVKDILAGVQLVDEDYPELNKKDVWICSFGAIFPNRRDLTPCLVRRHEQGKINTSIGTALMRMRKGNNFADSTKFVQSRVATIKGYHQTFNLFQDVVENGGHSPVESIEYADVYHLEYPAKPGDCGAPLIISNTGMQGKIAGMLVLGNDFESFFVPICLEDVRDALKKIDWRSKIAIGDLPENKTSMTIKMPKGNFQPIGECFAPPRGTKTQVVKSLMFDKVREHITEPVALTRKDGYDPLWNGLEKCGEKSILLDKDMLQLATDDVYQMFMTKHSVEHPPQKHRKVLTYEESLKGLDTDTMINSICRTTSAGYPWTLNKPTNLVGKKKWLGSDDDWKLDSPEGIEIRQSVEKMIDRAKEGYRCDSVFTDTLKDERRKFGKKARVFSAGNMNYTIASRMYFLDFVSYLQHNRILNQTAVGINPFSSEWKKLSSYLLTKGTQVIAGDFTNFDGSLSSEILWKVCEICNKFYEGTEEENRIREVLFSEITSGIHVSDNTMYQWNKSLPSGNPFTAIFNSVYNLISMRYVWLIMTQRSLLEFNKKIWMVAYGDDNVLNLSDDVFEIFNQQIISEGYKKIGMTYTDEAKQGITTTGRQLSEITFLKRKFIFDKDFMTIVCPIAQDTIFEMINWIRKGSLAPVEATATNVIEACKELSLWGRSKFEEWIDVILEAMPSEVEREVGNNISRNFLSYVMMYRSGEMAEGEYW